MEFRIERKVSFIEEATFEADTIEEAKEMLKEAKLSWNVDFELNPEIERVSLYDDTGKETVLPVDYMKEDYVDGMNGCIVFNEKEFYDETSL